MLVFFMLVLVMLSVVVAPVLDCTIQDTKGKQKYYIPSVFCVGETPSLALKQIRDCNLCYKTILQSNLKLLIIY